MSSLNYYNKDTGKWEKAGTYIQPSGEVWETIVDETTTEPIAQYQKDLGGEFKKVKIELIGKGANIRTAPRMNVTLNNDIFKPNPSTNIPRPIITTADTSSDISSPFSTAVDKDRKTVISIECDGICTAECVVDDDYKLIKGEQKTYAVEKLYIGDTALDGTMEFWAVSKGFAPYQSINAVYIYGEYKDTTTANFESGLHILIKGVRA